MTTTKGNTLSLAAKELMAADRDFMKTLVAALAEMYVWGVSPRKVKAITEDLCRHSFSTSAISAINKGLDKALACFASRYLDEPSPYLILDARYEKVRENGLIRSMAVQIAIGINNDGLRQVLAVETAHRESQSGWKEFLRLKKRGLSGVEFVVSEDHAGWVVPAPMAMSCGTRSEVRMMPIRGHAVRFGIHRDAVFVDHLPAQPTGNRKHGHCDA